MNETIVKLDAVARAKILEVFETEATKAFIKSVKDSTLDTGSFEVMITTDDIDRAGEMIRSDGWDFTNYLKSPVVLWGHDYRVPPIGVCTSLEKVGNGWLAKGKFAPTEFAQGLRKLYDLGMLRATSVGFIPNEMEGNVITKAELLEFSFVSVPCNPKALSTMKELKLNVREFITKGFMTKGEVAAEIDREEMMEQKYENLDSVWDVLYAFCSVYMDENTPVDNFTKLLTETISILATVADGSYVDPDAKMDTTGKTILAKLKGADRNAVDQFRKNVNAGRADSTATAAIKKAVEASKSATLVLESILAKSENGSEDKEEATTVAPEVVPPITEEAPKVPEVIEGEKILELRSVMQALTTMLGDSLAHARKMQLNQ